MRDMLAETDLIPCWSAAVDAQFGHQRDPAPRRCRAARVRVLPWVRHR